MAEDSDKCPSQFPKTQGVVLKCLVLSDQHLKTQRDSIYGDTVKQKNVLTCAKLEPENIF